MIHSVNADRIKNKAMELGFNGCGIIPAGTRLSAQLPPLY